jgi:hypothetical protein
LFVATFNLAPENFEIGGAIASFDVFFYLLTAELHQAYKSGTSPSTNCFWFDFETSHAALARGQDYDGLHRAF